MFGKKTKTADEILSLINDLSDEEKEKLYSALKEEPEKEESAPEEPAEETAEKVSDSESEAAEEMQGGVPAEETVESDGSETEEKEPAEEAQTEEPIVKDDEKDAMNALVARLDALEAELNEMKQKNAEAVEKEHDQDFGMNPGIPEGKSEDSERMSAVMRGYAGGNARNYM